MTHPLTADGSVELAVVERGGLDESRHLGAAVVLDPDGAVLLGLGDIDATVYPRSSLKPFQAVAMRRSGVPLDGPEGAIAVASHAGTPEHIALVESVLDRAGLDASALLCPLAYPIDPASARAAAAATRTAYNCSGKHAAFLAAAVRGGGPVDAYLDPEHPVQVAVRESVEELAGERIALSSVDGCGAPVHALTLRALARGIGRVVRDPDGGALTAAVLADPWTIDGRGRANTVIIEELGILVKLAAEGMLVAAAPDGTALALKPLDGGGRASTVAALTLLARVGAVDADAAARALERTSEKVMGGSTVVGRIRPSDAVRG